MPASGQKDQRKIQSSSNLDSETITAWSHNMIPVTLFLIAFDNRAHPPSLFLFNKWSGVTLPLRTGGQGHPTPNHTPTPPQTIKHTQKVFKNACFSTFRLMLTDGLTDGRTDQRTNGLTDGQSLSKSCVSATINDGQVYFQCGLGYSWRISQ